MSLPRRPRFDYADSVSWLLGLPCQPWTPEDSTSGGQPRITATGIPAVDLLRRDDLVRLTLRLYESEWPAALAFIAWAQEAEPFFWFPDQDDPSDRVQVLLESPAAGEEWGPVRDSEFVRTLELEIVLRVEPGHATAWRPYFQGFT